MTRASDNEFPSVLLDEQASAPTTPATGFWRVYAKSDGLYIVDDAGAETGPFGAGGGSGGGAMELIDSEVLGSATQTVTFASIPGTYNHLLIKAVARSDRASNEADGLQVRFNNDSGTNYGRVRGESRLSSSDAGSHVVTGDATGDTAMSFNQPAADATAGAAANVDISIPGYAGTTFWKAVTWSGGHYRGGTSDAIDAIIGYGMWRNTAAVTRIDLIAQIGQFVTGSSFYLYGIT
jgi:hypothetical protein